MGLTATIDRHFAKYFSDAVITNDLEEAHASIYGMSKKALQRFREFSPMFPSLIIVYREGVSEGQLDNILEREIQGTRQSP